MPDDASSGKRGLPTQSVSVDRSLPQSFSASRMGFLRKRLQSAAGYDRMKRFRWSMEMYRSGRNENDSKFLEATAVSSTENVRRTGLCAGSDFTISYRSCVFFLHSSGARITLEIYGELSERSKVRHSKCRVPKRNLGFESLTLRHKTTVILIELRWSFSMPENRLE